MSSNPILQHLMDQYHVPYKAFNADPSTENIQSIIEYIENYTSK